MKATDDIVWTVLAPRFREKESVVRFLAYARRLARVRVELGSETDRQTLVGEIRRAFHDSLGDRPSPDRQMLCAAGLVLADLVTQGWPLRVKGRGVQVTAPEADQDRVVEKERIKRQELVKRDAQLRQPAVEQFIRSMERTRCFQGRFVSIFSLMRDGRELAESLRQARTHSNNGWADALSQVVNPYLQFVSEDASCSLTGFRLMDIWRYFRHTWTNQYTSVPGRSMMFIVRDRAVPFHPVVGIGALSSPIVQIRERDIWIGWHPEAFVAEIRTNPTDALANWLTQVVDHAVDEIYIEDFLENGLITPALIRDPDEEVVRRLLRESGEQRRLHHRYARSCDHKQTRVDRADTSHWVGRARTHLFRSKRALALSEFLGARSLLKKYFGAGPSAKSLAQLAATSAGVSVIRKALKKAKANKIGISVADISVCGAIQPYNAILGGKLVSMLAASPEVVLEYKRRYSEAKSEIASAIAGRPVTKPPDLVVLGTTSLYGRGSSQYNRIRIPCELINGRRGESIEFRRLGHSESFGTSQYSQETVEALVTLVQQSANGQRINSIFGEGVSPKLRKVREGLDLLNFPSDVLLRHHRHRVVYAVNLVRNLRNYLLGTEAEPDYLVSRNELGASAAIAAWWRERWLRHRISSEPVLEEISRHTLVRPIRHGARVPRDVDGGEIAELFPDLGGV